MAPLFFFFDAIRRSCCCCCPTLDAELMRRDIADVHGRLVEMGDGNLHYFDGLEVFDLDLIAQYAEDACHPDGDGIEVMADNIDRIVMSTLSGS